MEFPKDEVKNKIVWTKGADFTDGSPRYTFEGRDPATTYERFQVVIYTERERRYAHDPGSLCNHYYGYVRDDKMECAETIGPYYSVREAKWRTLELFNSFVQQYAAQEDAHTTAAWIAFAEALADGVENGFEREAASLVAAFQEISERFDPKVVNTIYQIIHVPDNTLLSNEIIPAAEAAEQGASVQEISDMAADGLFGGGPMPTLKM